MHPPAVEVSATRMTSIWVRGKMAGLALCALGTIGLLAHKATSLAAFDLHKNTQIVVKNVQITTVSPVVLIGCGGPE